MNRFTLMEEETGGEILNPEVGAPKADAKWYDGFSEEVRGNQNINKFGSAEELAKSHINAQRMIGADKIPMPQTDEDWANVYGRLGRPDEANNYEIKMPEGMDINQDMQDSFKAFAHKEGYSQKQVQNLVDWQLSNDSNSQEQSAQASEQAHQQASDSLKAEWGEAYDQNVNLAIRGASEFLSESDKEFMNTALIDGVPAGEHPALLKLFNNVAKGMMEPSEIEGIANEGLQSPKEIEEERTALMANPAYFDRNHPEHKIINSKVQALFEKQFPNS